jgi:anti-anti-sigma regulatory factor
VVRSPLPSPLLERERSDMIVAVFEPPPRIDATNVAEFAKTVSRYLARHGCMVINCSAVVWITSSGMRVLEMASHAAPITLVNPSPAVHLMAATFAGDVRLRYDPVWSPPSVPEAPTRRLLPVHALGKVAS